MTDNPENAGAAGQAACAALLMLDTGGHMARIMDIAFTSDGRQLVSASDDKTIRVWDRETGRTVRTIRGESGPGHAGKIFAMALSPDGKWLAAGGYLGTVTGTKLREEEAAHKIRLYDFASGRLAALLKGHEDVVLDLAFSPDGRCLISGSADTTAIIWDIGSLSPAGPLSGSWAAVGQCSPTRRLSGHTAQIYAVGFTPDGARAVTGSYDHELRLWRVADGGEIARMPGHGDKVYSLAVARDGMIASGDWSGEVRLWDIGSETATGEKPVTFRKTLVQQGTRVGSLIFGLDGKTLLSGVGSYPFDCHVYDVASGREIVSYSGHDNIVLATAISPDGLWAATGGGGNHEIHLWDLGTGERCLGPDGQPLTFGGQGLPVWAAGFAEDGRSIAWGNAWRQPNPVDRGPLHHVQALPSAEDVLPQPRNLDATEAVAFQRATASQGDWSLKHRKEGDYGDDAILDVARDGKTIASIERGPTDGHAHRAYSFGPDGETIISGSGAGQVTRYDRQGKRLDEFIGHEGDVWAVAASPDGRFLVSGAADQTLRLWNLKTRELLVTLFHGADGKWVMWTPQGYYISSLDGDKYVGWQINRGPDKAADYVRASQLARRLFRPDIIVRTIELASAEAALREMGEALDITELLRVSRPPEFRILRPESGSTLTLTPASVIVEVEPNPDPVEGYDILVNGRQVATRDLRFFSGQSGQPERKPLSVPLQQGENDIRITAHNRIGTATRELSLHFAGEGDLDKRGTLYVVAIGVDDYTNCQAQSLRFAGADASAFISAMHRHAGPLHERVEARLLTTGGDAPPTRENIENAMLLFRDAEPADTVALFLAGHGAYDGPNYVFLPQDTGSDGRHYLPASVVRWHVFQEALQGARGRRLMFVDTCHSGGAYNSRLVKDAHDAEIIVFSATDSETLALELAELGHGAFTFALVQGLAGEADAQRNGDVELFALQSYVSRQVKSLTNGSQAPTIHLSGVKDFVIARKKSARMSD